MKSHTPKPNHLLVRARMELGLSQAKLAERLRVSEKQVRRWERGRAQPRPYCRRLLCTLFQKTAEELGLDAESPAPASPDFTEECLPSFLDLLPPLSQNLLIGREQDLAALRQYLLDGVSIIVAGMPGIGKTTLVSTLAHDPAIRNHFQDYILWAGLGRNPNVLEIMNTWGQILGVSPHHIAKKGKAALQAAIGDRAMCFLLDDVWESADAMHLHIGGPQCSYVYTSRFPRVTAELSGGTCLSYPLRELNEEQSFHVLRLLAPRAVAMEPEKTSELASAVGGLPLALNLVGRSLNLQSTTGQVRRVQTALERLSSAEERLQLLVEPLTSALVQSKGPSASSLTSVIATSEELLDEQARNALSALSILPSKPASFSEATALATAHCTVETLDLLCDLGFLECSGPDRYHMHQVIADYARNHLEGADREAAFLGLIASILELLETAADHYTRLDEEMQTILVALEAASARNVRHELIRMIGAATPFLMLRSQPALAERYLQHACQLAKQAQDDAPLPKLLWLLGNVLLMLDRMHEAATAYQEGIQVARALHDEENLCKLLADLGWQMHLFGLAEQAELSMHEGMELASRHGLKEQLVILYKIQGSVAWTRGDYAHAEEAYQHGLRLLAQLEKSKRKDLGAYYCFLGWMAGVQGCYEQAEDLFQRSIEATEYYAPDVSVFVWGMRCTIQVLSRPDATVRESLERVLQRAQEYGVGYSMYVYKALALLELALGNTERAEQEAQRGLAIARQVQATHQPGELLTVLATIALQRGDVEQAARLLEQAFPLVRATSSAEERATTIAARGEVLLRRRLFEEAEAAFQETLQTAPHEHKPLVALARYGLARVAAGQGDVSKALQQGEQALQVFASLRHTKTSEVRRWLNSLRRHSSLALQEALDHQNEQGIITTTAFFVERTRAYSPEESEPPTSASA
jgi:tetratricopeptide (TPR) repeat protein/transcriptional regulator with XRE-family HTH domain